MPNELMIPEAISDKMFGWAVAAHKLEGAECCWLLQIVEPKEGGLLLEDVVLPDQESTAGHTEMKQSGEWLKGIKLDQAVKFKGWGHSHHTMGTFYSGTDDDTLLDKWNGESTHNNHYAVGLVISFPNNIKAWVVYYKPIETTKIELPVRILRPPQEDKSAIYEAQVKERLKKKVWNYYQSGVTSTTNLAAAAPTATKSLERSDDLDEWEKGELATVNPEDIIFDNLTGFSVTKLKESGMWDDDYYADLKADVDSFNRKHRSHSKKTITDERTCMRQGYNQRGKIICLLRGKDPDCDKCKEKMPFNTPAKSLPHPASQTSLPLPPSNTSTTSEKKEAETTPVVESLSSQAAPEKSFCPSYKVEPMGICPEKALCLGCDHADTEGNRLFFAEETRQMTTPKTGKSIENS